MNTPASPPTETVRPCPWCGGTSVSVEEGSTFRWRILSCDNCGANTGEHRIQTMGSGGKEQWEAKCRAEMLEVWNKRHSPEPAAQQWADIPADVRTAIEDYNGLLRTFHSVAGRCGMSTNWDVLQGRIRDVLDKHHATWRQLASQPTPVQPDWKDEDSWDDAHKQPQTKAGEP